MRSVRSGVEQLLGLVGGEHGIGPQHQGDGIEAEVTQAAGHARRQVHQRELVAIHRQADA